MDWFQWDWRLRERGATSRPPFLRLYSVGVEGEAIAGVINGHEQYSMQVVR